MPKYILCTKTSDGNLHYRSFNSLYEALRMADAISEDRNVKRTLIYQPISVVNKVAVVSEAL